MINPLRIARNIINPVRAEPTTWWFIEQVGTVAMMTRCDAGVTSWEIGRMIEDVELYAQLRPEVEGIRPHLSDPVFQTVAVFTDWNEARSEFARMALAQPLF
jgi:hypothetical protein